MGFALFFLLVVIAFAKQLVLRNTVLHSDEDVAFQPFRDAMLSEDWLENIKNVTEARIRDENRSDGQDEDTDDKDDTDQT